jgi:hypothetical protein
VQATADIYCGTMRRLMTERRLELLVHPVPPVLDATRDVVLRFQAVLRQQVGCSRVSPSGSAGRVETSGAMRIACTKRRRCLQGDTLCGACRRPCRCSSWRLTQASLVGCTGWTLRTAC